MPDPPDYKPRAIPTVPMAQQAAVAFAELNCKTNFSFLQGASHPDELVNRAGKLGYRALAITDHNSLAGVVRAHGQAKKTGLKLLIGAEIAPQDAPPLVLLAKDRKAYGRLSRLLTAGKIKAPKGECHITLDDIASHAEGLIAAVVGSATADELFRYREVFSDRCYLFGRMFYGPDDVSELVSLQQVAKRTRVPLVASNHVRFHHPSRKPLADVLTAIREGCKVAEAGELLLPNAERYLKSPSAMWELFAVCPDAIHRTIEIGDRCHFNLDELRYDYPEELSPRGVTPLDYLIQLTWQGATERYPDGLPDKVRSLIEHELALIGELRYEAYFLTVWDLVHFARSRDILCQGRGSSANSVVCYCLGITAVNPERLDMLFERFMSKERNEPPDIDVDFEHQRREEVLQYVYDKYGRERSAMTAEVITYRPRSAIRDVGKALGFSLDKIDALAKTIDRHPKEMGEHCKMVGINPDARQTRLLISLVDELLGFPRHLGQHVGGMVITQRPLCELVPIENAAMENRTVIEWDKNDLDETGFLKVDCLALGMLTAIHKCFDLVEKHHGRTLTMANIPEGDEAVYDMICAADCLGVFQIESRAQLSMLPRLQPRCFYDLAIEIAIVRPGPIQGEMVHPYLKRRCGEEQPDYPNDEIKAVLERTMGVPLFQEQAMKLAIVAAGFTPGEADQLRRAMTAWRAPGIIDEFRNKLIAGMQRTGYSTEFAEQVFKQIRGFGEYGFPESHAASFALIAYVSAWLKHYYPAEFCVALLNSQPMGFYAPAQLVWDAREHCVEVRPVDVNHSNWDSIIEGGAIRLGMRMIGGLRASEAELIVANREAKQYQSMDDFTRRSCVAAATLTRLARADAFASLQLTRRASLWRTLQQEKSAKARPLFDGLDEPINTTALPPMSPQQEVFADYKAAGLSLKDHPIKFFREQLDRLRVVPGNKLASLPDKVFVRVAGIVLVRQRPGTAKGITFVTIEDETGPINLIIKMDVWNKFYKIARTASGYVAHGKLQNYKGVIHVLVSKLENLPKAIASIDVKSRDFH
jgi:error-prone DNA polymerase